MKNTELKNLFIKASEDELSEAVGGISIKGVRNSVIIGVSTLLGSGIGTGAGAITGGFIGGATGNIQYNPETNEVTTNKNGLMIANVSILAGKLSGAAVGAAIGQKIINYLDN